MDQGETDIAAAAAENSLPPRLQFVMGVGEGEAGDEDGLKMCILGCEVMSLRMY